MISLLKKALGRINILTIKKQIDDIIKLLSDEEKGVGVKTKSEEERIGDLAGEIDQSALVEELKEERIFACLDVTNPEPPPSGSRLRGLKNIVLAPHTLPELLTQACRI